ncbi:unnamed protein product [Orchesella dallaii]|uniref:Uncharacterized protein n=1 Tax=Orchesella dallaii TaxID=48710 RepID=A0ABP1RV14_9HEXA
MNLRKTFASASKTEIKQEIAEVDEDVNVEVGVDITYEIGVVKIEDENQNPDNYLIVEEQDQDLECDFEHVFLEEGNEEDEEDNEIIDGPVIVQITSKAGQPKTTPKNQEHFRRKISELQFELEQKCKEHHKLLTDWEAVTREWRVQRRNWEAEKRGWEKEKREFEAKLQCFEREKDELLTQKRELMEDKRELENDQVEFESEVKGWDDAWAVFEEEKKELLKEELKVFQKQERQHEINRQQKKKRRWLKTLRQRLNEDVESWEIKKKVDLENLEAQKSKMEETKKKLEVQVKSLESQKRNMNSLETERKEFQKEKEMWRKRKRNYDAERSHWEGEIASWLNKKPKWEKGVCNTNEIPEFKTNNVQPLQPPSTSTSSNNLPQKHGQSTSTSSTPSKSSLELTAAQPAISISYENYLTSHTPNWQSMMCSQMCEHIPHYIF